VDEGKRMSDPTRDLFDEWAKGGRGEGMEEGHFPRAEQALENIPIMPGEHVLDLGCGNGWATRWLRHCVGEDGKAVGIDLAPEMIELARKSVKDAKGIEFIEGAFESLPFPDGVIDHAFSMEALYYAPETHVALTDIARVIRPEGTLTFCTDFYAENPYCHGWPEMMGIPMIMKSEAGWCQALEEAGFKVLETQRCFDPREVGDDVDASKAADIRDFRENVGSLSILAQKK
jgi:arsenite methyltransferase